MDPLDPAPLGRAATVVRDRGHVGDGADIEPARLQAADGGLTAGPRTLDEDLDRLQTVLHRTTRGGLGGDLRGERRAFARPLESLRARRPPGDDVAVGVGEADDGVVERRQHVRLTHSDVLALAATGPDDFLLLGHDYFVAFLRRTPTVLLGTRRVRALVLVR